jgi:ZIP family zinc transporter
MNLFPVLLTVITFFSTLLGGNVAARYRKNLGVLAAFASGILIAVPLFEILPETFKLAPAVSVSVNDIMTLIAVGFIFLYILDRHLLLPRSSKSEAKESRRRPLSGIFATSQLSAHSFLDGLAIGISFQFNTQVGLIVAVAVICHDFSDGLSTFTVMLNSGNSLRASMRMLFLDAVAPVFGAIATLFVQVPSYYIVLFLPFFAGGFLYLGASDLLPQAHIDNPRLITLVSCIAGFALIFTLARVLNV